MKKMNHDKITVFEAFRAVLQKWWLVLIFTLFSTGVSWYVTDNVIDPVYESKVNILIASKLTDDSSILTTSIDDSLKLINTYSDILTSSYIFKSAEQELSLDGHDLIIDPELVKVTNIENSQVITLVVQNQNATEAALIAGEISKAFDNKVQTIMGLREKNAKVLNKPTINHDPVSPNHIMIISITFLLALIASIWFSIFIHFVKLQKK
ncbi:YveK family protein [Jeotgalibacillus salarius]|uniref:Polysaccharide chain length determinant N-terminal domain-containing protein n=1 Tax=Jeotgalibacillus salarius TaxID=546023 RepID=A0A4Y8LM79_9BACL|nr:Wzz/FepE/Etk N-terminal domain-containing protein [Jeotgalibacillus salarius]TFE04138.1 hypothetical protein E2626_02090 [Jeotgalibacillus salarius]